MDAIKGFMLKSTLALTGVILASFLLAAMGGLIDSVYLVYFWYLGLASIVLLMLISLLVGVTLFVNRCCKWGERQKKQLWHDGAVGLF